MSLRPTSLSHIYTVYPTSMKTGTGTIHNKPQTLSDHDGVGKLNREKKGNKLVWYAFMLSFTQCYFSFEFYLLSGQFWIMHDAVKEKYLFLCSVKPSK